MITNLAAVVVLTLVTNTYEHHWNAVTKTRVYEVSEKTTWTFPGHDIPYSVRGERPLFQNATNYVNRNGQWVEVSTSTGMFVPFGQYECGVGWLYIPYPVVPAQPERVNNNAAANTKP